MASVLELAKQLNKTWSMSSNGWLFKVNPYEQNARK